jgi:regulator of nucleoside diphosphate kinase
MSASDTSTTRNILISDFDRKRLLALIDGYEIDPLDQGAVDELREEIENAGSVAPSDVPPDLVTMNTRVRLADTRTGATRVITVVFPGVANADDGKVSVLAPLGLALLGYSVGDAIEPRMRGNVSRFRIEAIEYQPEAAGDWRA